MCRINWSMQVAELPRFSTVIPGQNGINGGIMTVALEAFCLMMFQWFGCRVAERQKPQLIFINRGPCMIRHHQDSLLPCLVQGEASHEIAATTCNLVCTDSVSHTADIHAPDPVPPVRAPAKGWKQGGCCNSGLRIW